MARKTPKQRPRKTRTLKRLEELFQQAQAKYRQNHFDEALDLFSSILKARPCHMEARTHLVEILEMAHSPTYDKRLASLISSCLQADGVNYEALSRGAAIQIRHKYEIPDHPAAMESREITPSTISKITKDVLFINFLNQTINRDYALEVFLTGLRREVGLAAFAGGTPHGLRNSLRRWLARRSIMNTSGMFQTRKQRAS
jgi:thioredoxin-like negative regulator of GroEL